MESELYYRIHFSNDERTAYRLIEYDEWDEFHQVEILNNVRLVEIFLILDIMGAREKLRSVVDWEEYLEETLD